jgi:hypothetical protein
MVGANPKALSFISFRKPVIICKKKSTFSTWMARWRRAKWRLFEVYFRKK